MKIFGGEVSNDEIDKVVAQKFDEFLGQPDELDQGRFSSNYEAMLESLKGWADENNLSMWKHSRIFAGIELGLKRLLPNDLVAERVSKAREIIMG